MADRVTKLTLVVSLVTGLVGGVFKDVFQNALFHPKLRLSFDPHIGDGHKCVSVSLDRDERETIMGRSIYVRVEVKNTGRISAKNCRAFLNKIERLQDDGNVLLHEDPLPLFWSFLEAGPMEIPAKMTYHFDLFHTESRKDQLIPCTKPFPVNWLKVLAQPGVYLFTAVVTADQVMPKLIRVKAEWNGEWGNFSVRSG
jgi:hypothetical protein